MEQSLPVIVRAAEELAARMGFPLRREHATGPSCSLPDAGRVLAVLAAQRPSGRLAEIGTGVGMGAAWISWGMDPASTLVTVEVDHLRAVAAAELFADDDRVWVVEGDATEVLADRGPFDLLFLDGPVSEPASVIELLAPGGALVVDDMTPIDLLPADSPYRHHDPKRELFADPRLISAEFVLPNLRDSVMVGVRSPARHAPVSS